MLVSFVADKEREQSVNPDVGGKDISIESVGKGHNLVQSVKLKHLAHPIAFSVVVDRDLDGVLNHPDEKSFNHNACVVLFAYLYCQYYAILTPSQEKIENKFFLLL